jgi:hypothetical protein
MKRSSSLTLHHRQVQAKMLVRRPVFAMYPEAMQSRCYWRYSQRALERQIAAVA